jgi:hypothetical protein
MVFGTNTSVGVKVGTDPSQIPAVQIGYNRQEAVVMPLLANTLEKEDADNMLSPCRPVMKETDYYDTEKNTLAQTERTFAQDLDADTAKIHPCKFVGIRAKGGKLVAQDSYSVLASFGAEISGKAKDPEAAVGIAQYFATGIAAQTLAANGGAAVVSVGKGAEESAKSAAATAAFSGVLGEEPFEPAGKYSDPYDKFAEDFAQKIDAAADDAAALTGMANFKTAAAIPAEFLKCTTKDECKSTIKGSGDLYDYYTAKGDDFMRTALAKF